MNEQLPVEIEVTRQNGEWLISITAPRWFVEELDSSDVKFMKASSTYASGSLATQNARIHIAVKKTGKDSE